MVVFPGLTRWPTTWPSLRDTHFRPAELDRRLESYGRQVSPSLRGRIKEAWMPSAIGPGILLSGSRDTVKSGCWNRNATEAHTASQTYTPWSGVPKAQVQWRAGKRRLALQEAARAIELELQSRVRTDRDGNDLNTPCFGDKHLLRVPGRKAGGRL